MLSEPVRLYMYGLLGPIVALLVTYDVLGESDAPKWIALGTAVLGVPAVEVARRRVTPLSDPRDKHGKPLTP